jgi:hypothetical protein
MAEVMAQQDSLQAAGEELSDTAAESLATTEAESAPVFNKPPWYEPLIPVLDARVQADVSRVVVTGGLEAPIGRLFKMQGRARLSGTNTSYRQFDREVDATNFDLGVVGKVPSWGDLDVQVLRNSSFDENVLPQGALVLEYEAREIHASLTGNRDLGTGFRAHWGLRGDVEDLDRTDRGVSNDRSLAGGAVNAVWGNRGPWHDFSTRYGYDRQSGERTLRDQPGDAVTERDTLWVRGNVNGGPRFNVTRNFNGVVDTLGVLNPVGEEHESSWQNSWTADLRSRPLPRLAMNAGASQSYSESSHTFSREGLVQLGTSQFDAEGIIRYAMAGSLKVRFNFLDRFNDRRPRGSIDFRGKESRISRNAVAQFRHGLSQIIDLHLDLQETLDQNINEALTNENDRDRHVLRSDLKLLSDPWRWFQVEVAGAYSLEQEINIDAARVDNNQDSDLYEVRGNFLVDPEGGWRFIQNYRLQIRIIDRIGFIQGDKFNKQGQWDNRVEYRFANGVFIDGQYLVDYRRNGDRDTSRPDDEVYIYRGARRDHRVGFGVRVPVAGMDFDARTERGFLRDNSLSRPLIEDRGKITVGLRGDWRFWRDRGTFTLNASRILQFGPRVLDVQKDYWLMNTSMRVAF